MKDGVDEEDAEADAADAVDDVEEGAEAAATWLIVESDLSMGRPWRSKYLSAVAATCSAVIVSTSLPISSLMRGGTFLRTCSRRM